MVSQMNRYHSLSQLLPYESYDPETAIFYNKKSVGFILEAAPLTGIQESDIKILSTLIADSLPNDCDLQFLLWASNKIGPILDEFVACRTKNNENSILNTQIINWLAEKRRDFLKRGTMKSLSKNTQLLLRDFKLYLILSFPLTL